jgi:hypothetical protein
LPHCKIGEPVKCPDLKTVCAGNQCCPGGWQCPSADNRAKNLCPHGKPQDCTKKDVEVTIV